MIALSIRDTLREQASRYLIPGEQLQQVMWGTSIRPLKLYTGTWLFADGDSYRAVLCTDHRTILLRGGRWNASLEEVLETADRGKRLGPPRGLLYHQVPVFTNPVYIGRRFFRDVRAADASTSESGAS